MFFGANTNFVCQSERMPLIAFWGHSAQCTRMCQSTGSPQTNPKAAALPIAPNSTTPFTAFQVGLSSPELHAVLQPSHTHALHVQQKVQTGMVTCNGKPVQAPYDDARQARYQ
jgi:hypothetical protein